MSLVYDWSAIGSPRLRPPSALHCVALTHARALDQSVRLQALKERTKASNYRWHGGDQKNWEIFITFFHISVRAHCGGKSWSASTFHHVGAFSSSTLNVLSDLGRRINDNSGDARETAYLLQRILSLFSASIPCFCTTLWLSTRRIYSHPAFGFNYFCF